MAFPYLSDFVSALTGFDLPLPLPMFGIMFAVALLVSIAVAAREVRRLHEAGRIGLARRRIKAEKGHTEVSVPPQEIVVELGIIVAIVGIIGARVFHLLEYPQEFIADPWGMIFSRGGFTIFGGLIFGTVAGAIYIKRCGLSVPAVCDGVAPAMMLGYAIGRIGCQLSGDGDWGVAADLALKPGWLPTWLWAQTYDNNIVGVTIAPPGVYPAPIYETLMGLVAFGILCGLRRHPFQAGWLFALYLVLCAVERFAIELIRVNSVVYIFGIAATQAQIISVLLIGFGTLGLAMLSNRRMGPKPRLG